jgi:hypothetical protein
MVVRTTFRFPWKIELPIDMEECPYVMDCVKYAEEVNRWLDASLDGNNWHTIARDKHNPENKPQDGYPACDHILVNWITLRIQFYVKTDEDVALLRLKWG